LGGRCPHPRVTAVAKKDRNRLVGGAFAGGGDQPLDFVFGEAGQEPGFARDR